MTKINIKYLNGDVVEKFELKIDAEKLDNFSIMIDGHTVGKVYGVRWADGNRIGQSIPIKDGLIIEIKRTTEGELDEGKQEPTKPEPVG